MKGIIHGLLVLLLPAMPAAVQGQSGSGDGFDYTINPGNTNTITITDYTGTNAVVAISTNINGLLVTGIQSDDPDESVFGIGVNSVTIPASVTSIGSSVFLGGDLTNVMIGSGVTSIGEDAFFYCMSLAAITVDAQNSVYSSLNGVLFDKSQTTLIQFPTGLDGSYTIPSSVTRIGVDAFDLCRNLTNVTMANGIASIGEDAFAGCFGLTSITIPDSVTNIGSGAFYDCPWLTNVTIPASVNSIGESAFDACISLTSVTVPNSVTNLGEWAFANCSSLTSVTIPGSASFGEYVFLDCTSLTNVYFTGNAPAIGSDAFEDDPVTLYYLPGTTGWGAFSASTGLTPVLWNPLIQTADGSFGVQSNQFGFNITGTNNFTVVVEACTNLANPVWIPLTNATLTNGLFYFSDPQWTNYSSRYYGLGMP